MKNEKEKKKIGITSDLHLGHGNIMKYCSRTQFMTDEDREKFLAVKDDNGQAFRSLKMSHQSIDNMDNGIIGNINEVIMPEDELWILGDFAFANNYKKLLDYRNRINCKNVKFVWGNHDDRWLLKYYTMDEVHCHEYEQPNIFQGYYESGLFFETENGLRSEDEIARECKDKKNPYRKNQKWYFNHYMNAVWHSSHHNTYCLYGHSHQGAEKWREEHMPSACCFDVGVDGNDFKPYLLDDIKKQLDEKSKRVKPHAIDHHEEKIKIVRDKSGKH